MLLLLDSRAELHELLGYGLVGLLEDVDQAVVESKVSVGVHMRKGTDRDESKEKKKYSRSRVSLVVLCEQRDGFALLARTACPADAVHVVLDGEREL